MSRILVVDDEAAFRGTLREVLEDAGHEVVEASDGAQGLRMAGEMAPDLIITDIVMPGMEGMETIGEIRRRHPRVKLIAMSGGGSVGGSNYLDIALRLGAHRVLSKPFAMAELIDSVADLVGPSA